MLKHLKCSYFVKFIMAFLLLTFTPVVALPPKINLANLSQNETQFKKNIIDLNNHLEYVFKKSNSKKEMTKATLYSMLEDMQAIQAEIYKNRGIRISIRFYLKKLIEENEMNFSRKLTKLEYKAILQFFSDYQAQYFRENELKFGKNEKIVTLSKNKLYEEPKKVEVSLKMMIGITGALCGFFILMIPLPVPGKVQVGSFLVATGIKYCVDAIIEEN